MREETKRKMGFWKQDPLSDRHVRTPKMSERRPLTWASTYKASSYRLMKVILQL